MYSAAGDRTQYTGLPAECEPGAQTTIHDRYWYHLQLHVYIWLAYTSLWYHSYLLFTSLVDRMHVRMHASLPLCWSSLGVEREANWCVYDAVLYMMGVSNGELTARQRSRVYTLLIAREGRAVAVCHATKPPRVHQRLVMNCGWACARLHPLSYRRR